MRFRFWRRRERPVDIDELIAAAGVPASPEDGQRRRWMTHDDSLRVRAQQRRAEADKRKAAALRLETTDEQPAQIRRVK